MQAERAHLRPELARELVGLVDLVGARRDLRLGEALDRVAQHVGGFAEIEIERSMSVREHGGVVSCCPILSGRIAQSGPRGPENSPDAGARGVG